MGLINFLFKKAGAAVSMQDVPRVRLLIADFNSGQLANSLGGRIYSSEERLPAYDEIPCRVSIVNGGAGGEKGGKSLRVEHDLVKPGMDSVSNCKLDLLSANLSPYNTLRLYLKGDSEAGFSPRLKLLFIDDRNRYGIYLVSGISSTWTKFDIPFEAFRRKDLNWSSMKTFSVMFDGLNVTPTKGAVFIDNIEVIRM